MRNTQHHPPASPPNIRALQRTLMKQSGLQQDTARPEDVDVLNGRVMVCLQLLRNRTQYLSYRDARCVVDGHCLCVCVCTRARWAVI